MSAAESEPPGCPEPALCIARIMSILTFAANVSYSFLFIVTWLPPSRINLFTGRDGLSSGSPKKSKLVISVIGNPQTDGQCLVYTGQLCLAERTDVLLQSPLVDGAELLHEHH